MKSPFLQNLQSKGLLFQATDLEALDELFANKEPVVAYIGFDPTASSLHVGNLSQIMTLRLLQQHGHKPIVLIGGATAQVGDPSGKDEMRQQNSDETIATNIAGIKECFAKFLKFGNGPTDAVLVNNADWLMNINYIDFLKNYGRHFSINRMLSFDSVKSRLDREQPLSFLEFNYMILQAYDFMELFKKHKCVLQLGGSDQWGNIVNGVELTRRVLGKPVFGLTSPLVTTASGVKMGKTAKGAVWLNDNMLSPFEYWQFWRNTDDADVIRYMKIFTDFTIDDLEKYAKLEGSALNNAKIALADAATGMCHGTGVLTEIHAQVQAAFGAGSDADLPTKWIEESQIDIPTLETLLVASGLCASKGEAKRLAQGGGLRINGEQVTDPRQEVDVLALRAAPIKISLGKKQHCLVQVR
ncbi:MAG: tyrosine--tRNA ligase [Proteobacteria bacterium]|jgi:tyrosyl-tRNA synthetase|nr:tyrosine--tRNA ligase [Pseudomonadota bacterium]